MHRSCPEKETIEKSVFPEETWGSRVPSAHLRGFPFERKVGRFSLVEEKETLRPWDLPGEGQKQRERRMKGGGWTNGGPVSRIVDELISTRMAVQRRFFAVCRGKLDSNWQSLNLYLGFARNSSFDFRNRFRFFFSRIEFFLILSPISFDPTIARCFQTVFRETSRSREGRI